MADSNELQELTAEFQSYIVSPLNAFGLGGFVFDIDDEARTRLEADITDHFTEKNNAVQDHIARKPVLVTLRGFVGELVYKPDGEGVQGILQQVTQNLTELAALAPTLTTASAQAQSIISSGSVGFNEALSDSANIYGLVKNLIGAVSGDEMNQQQAYQYFKACWQQGILMGIQTPWEFLTNMAILNVVAIQDGATDTMTDFAVTYKQMNFAQTSSQAYSPSIQDQANGTNAADTAAANAGTVASPASVLGVQTSDLPPIQQGVAAVQAADPVSIGTVPGVFLPSPSLPGAQSAISSGSDLANNSSVEGIFISGNAPPLR